MKPCPSPACGSTSYQVLVFNEAHQVMCCECLVRGPLLKGKNKADDGWDALPRFGAKLNPIYDDSSPFDDVDSSAETEEHVRINNPRKGE